MRVMGNLFAELDFGYSPIPAVHLMSHVFSLSVERWSGNQRLLPPVVDFAVSRVIVHVNADSKRPEYRTQMLNRGARMLSAYFVNYRDASAPFHYCRGKTAVFAYPIMSQNFSGWDESAGYGRELFRAAKLLAEWTLLVNSVCRICKENAR